MQTGVVDLSRLGSTSASALEVSVTLSEPGARLRVRLPGGEAGRAEASFRDRSWAAKHYWLEAPGVMIYEFDEPLPAGEVTLRIPFARSA
jgi:hypothetical protein